MTKRDAYTRRQRNQALSQLDAAHRCTECKRPLAEAVVIVEDLLIIDGKFCCDACLMQHRERVNR